MASAAARYTGSSAAVSRPPSESEKQAPSHARRPCPTNVNTVRIRDAVGLNHLMRCRRPRTSLDDRSQLLTINGVGERRRSSAPEIQQYSDMHSAVLLSRRGTIALGSEVRQQPSRAVRPCHEDTRLRLHTECATQLDARNQKQRNTAAIAKQAIRHGVRAARRAQRCRDSISQAPSGHGRYPTLSVRPLQYLRGHAPTSA